MTPTDVTPAVGQHRDPRPAPGAAATPSRHRSGWSPLRTRLLLVDLAGALALGWAGWACASAPTPSPVSLVVMVALQVVGRLVDLPLRVGQRRIHAAGLVETGLVLGLVLAGPWTVFAVAAVALGRQLHRRTPAYKALFNTMNFAGPAAAAAALAAAGPATVAGPALAGERAAVLLAAGLVFALTNFVAVQSVVAAAGRDRLWPSLRAGAGTAVGGALVGTVLGVLVVLELDGVPALLAVVPALAAAAMLASRRRHAARTEVDVLPRLAAASRRIRSLDTREALTEVCERGVELFAADTAEVVLLGWPGAPGTQRWVRTAPYQGRWAVAPGHGLGEVDTDRVLRSPLLADTELMGEVRLSFARQPTLSEQEQHVLDAYVSAAAGAVEHSRMFALATHQARTDALTGIGNTRALAEAMDALMPTVLDRTLTTAARTRVQELGAATALRVTGGPAAVVAIDLDHFKGVNDTLGHLVGNTLLTEVALVLRSSCRAGDLAARVGGDEFCLLLSNVSSAAHAASLTASVLAEIAAINLAAAVPQPGMSVRVTATAGIALAPTDGTTLTELLRAADTALLVGKRRQRGTVTVFDTGMDAAGPEAADVTAELAGALTRGEVSVRYAPQVDTGTGLIVGVHAVPSWEHPVLGELSQPKWTAQLAVTPVAEPLALHLVDQAAGQAARWRADTGRDVPVTVEIAARCLLADTFAGDVAYALVRHHIPGHLLTLLVTDQADSAWPDRAAPMVQALASVGVGVGVTRYTGDGSMVALAGGGQHVVTLDPGVVRDAAGQPAAGRTAGAAAARAQAVVLGTVAVAGHRGARVTAQGVHSAADHRLVTELGVHTAQGSHHGDPVPAHVMTALLTAQLDGQESQPGATASPEFPRQAPAAGPPSTTNR